jgi:hypothetical protein
MPYLLDTNILERLAIAADAKYVVAVRAVVNLDENAWRRCG